MTTIPYPAALLTLGLVIGLAMPAAAEGDAAKGEKVFAKCKVCHSMEEGKNMIGPHLAGVVGRPVAGLEDFRYSTDLRRLGKDDKVWDQAMLDAFLADPRKVAAKTKMAFAGLRKSDERADVIAFMAAGGAE